MKTLSNKFVIIICSLFVVFSSGCKQKSERDILNDEVVALEKSLFEDKTAELDKDKAVEMIKLYTSFSEKFAEDTLAPEYLFRASSIAENINQPNNSVNYLTRIEDKYPDYKNYAICIFKKAYLYDTRLRNVEKAREYYQLFIDKYPNHELASVAESSLMFLGMSDEELLETMRQLSK